MEGDCPHLVGHGVYVSGDVLLQDYPELDCPHLVNRDVFVSGGRLVGTSPARLQLARAIATQAVLLARTKSMLNLSQYVRAALYVLSALIHVSGAISCDYQRRF